MLFIAHTQAQAKMLIDTEIFDLGEVEWKQPATVYFNLTNAGNQPLVISEIIPDCACSAVKWTTSPIAPGQTGEIAVTFDAQALGSFQKSVAVMSNADELRYLYFRGKVVEKLKDYSRTHPYHFDGLRIDQQEIVFPDATKGERPTFKISVVNQSNKPYEPIIMHLPAYVEMEVSSPLLEHGERGEIKLTLNTELLSNVGLNEAIVYLSRFTGDKVSQENAIQLKSILLPNFSELTESEKHRAPQLDIKVSDTNLSQALAVKNKAKCDITLTNKGQLPLKIINLQVLGSGASISLKKNTLEQGKSTRLRVTLNKKALNKQKDSIELLLITNDPKQPKTAIKINY